jgi:hypothetical protein
VVVEPTARGRLELLTVVAKALHTERVILADDALMKVPTLVIERTTARDDRGQLLNGRELSAPQSFSLYLHRGGCVLVQAQSGRNWLLRDVKCRSIAAAHSP